MPDGRSREARSRPETDSNDRLMATTYSPGPGAQSVSLECLNQGLHFINGNAAGSALSLTLSNMGTNQAIMIRLLQGAVASTVASWFSGYTIKWFGTVGTSTPPTLSAAGNVTWFSLVRTGEATLEGFAVGKES